jgi:hypothetical protein
MSDLWIVVGVAAAAVVGLGLVGRARRARDAGPAGEFVPDGRDGRLAVRLSRTVGCTPLEALPAVRHELGLSPTQTDDVILKRAAYHYRNALPERPRAAYRDRVRG